MTDKLKTCWYTSPTRDICRKCGQIHAGFIDGNGVEQTSMFAIPAATPSPSDAALNDAYAEGRKDEREANEWQPIETAPKHTEVLVWRADSGPFIAKLTTPDAVITPEEMEREGLEFPDDFEEWFSDAYGWQENDERPTHWMPLPAAPVTGEAQ